MKRQSNLQRHHHHHPIYISRSDSSCCSSTASMTSLDSDNTTTLLALPPDASLRNSTTTTTNNNDELAVKYLKSKCKLTKSQRARGRVDLGLEVEALTLLRDHSNIVTIRAVNTSSNNPSEVNFFLMDRLYGTIEQKIAREWRDRSLLSLSNAIIPGLPMRLSFEQCTDEEEPLLLERLQVASQVASALEYIHSERYVNRKEGKKPPRVVGQKTRSNSCSFTSTHTHTHIHTHTYSHTCIVFILFPPSRSSLLKSHQTTTESSTVTSSRPTLGLMRTATPSCLTLVCPRTCVRCLHHHHHLSLPASTD